MYLDSVSPDLWLAMIAQLALWLSWTLFGSKQKSLKIDSSHLESIPRGQRERRRISRFRARNQKKKASDARDSRLDRLGNGSDLVDLEQKRVTGTLLDGGLDPLGVGDGQIISDDLDGRALGDVGPSLPVVLVEGVLRARTVYAISCLRVE